MKVPPRVWNDKEIKPEGKLIYSYIYSKCFDRIVTNLYVGELQQVVRISNKGLKNNLEKLEKNNYITYEEYANGMYTIGLTR